MASLQMYIITFLILLLITNVQTYSNVQNLLPFNNLLQPFQLSRLDLLGNPVQPPDKQEKLYGLPPLPMTKEDTDNLDAAKLSTPKVTKSRRPFKMPLLPLFPPLGMLQFTSTGLQPERPPQHESKYTGLFAPDGSYLGDSPKFKLSKPKNFQDLKYRVNDKQMYDKSSSGSYTNQLDNVKNAENVKPNIVFDDITINDDDPVLDKVNVTYNDDTARKRFTKYARNDDDSDLLQKSDGIELYDKILQNPKTEHQDQQEFDQKQSFVTIGNMHNDNNFNIHHLNAQQRLDTTSIRKIYTPYDVATNDKGFNQALTKDGPSNIAAGVFRSVEEKKVNGIDRSIINDKFTGKNRPPQAAFDDVTIFSKARSNNQQQVEPSDYKANLTKQTETEEEGDIAPIPAFTRSPEDNMYLKDIEDYDQALEAKGRNIGFLSPNHVPPQLQMFIPTTTAASFFPNYQPNLLSLQQPYRPPVFPLSQPFQYMLNPGFITPAPYQPPNIFTPSPEIKRLFNIDDSLRPWPFSNIQQFPSVKIEFFKHTNKKA